MQLFALTREIFLFCQSHHIFLRVAFIPGRRNVLADSLSRRGQVLETECMLSKPIFRQIHNLIPRIQLDLFATSRNNQLPLFVSPCPDDQAWAVDAMSLGWVGLFAYAYPPRILISEILRKVQDTNCVVALVAPSWPSQPWFRTLLQFSG